MASSDAKIETPELNVESSDAKAEPSGAETEPSEITTESAEDDGRWKGAPHCRLCIGNMPILRETRPRPNADPLVWKGPAPDKLALQIADDKTGIMRQYKWDDGTEIIVQFMWPDQPKAKEFTKYYKRVEKLVRETAPEWEQCTNITFRFISIDSNEEAHICVNFLSDEDHYDNYEDSTGNWSELGQECNDKNPAMNFDFLSMLQKLDSGKVSPTRKDHMKKYMRSTVLHEFGHALGFIHEHLRGDRDRYFLLNMDAIIKKNEEKHGWDEKMTRSQVDRLVKMDYLKASSFDIKSIMIYPFKADMVIPMWGRAMEVQETFELSPMDKQWASIVYPPIN